MIEEDRDIALSLLNEGILDFDFYVSQISDVIIPSPIEAARHYLDIGEKSGLSPSGSFDPEYYVRVNPDLQGFPSPTLHYIEHGRREGRPSSLALQLIADELDDIAVQEGLIPAPEVGRSDSGYVNALAVALRVIDEDLRYFSKATYISSYPDLAGHPIDPLVHFLKYGRDEGRVTNVSLFRRIHLNGKSIKEDRPYVIIGVHEASKTGAPIVGLDLAKEMMSSYNIIFISMRDGPLIEEAQKLFPVVIVASQLDSENYYYAEYIKNNYKVKDAIFSSSVCFPLIQVISYSGYRTTCLIHEFFEYMIPARSLVYFCDLLVFSSRQLLKSWRVTLDNFARDPGTVMILPQPASSANVRVLSKNEARVAVAEATGLDLEGAALILGAGQIQIRKGTDIFLQIANQLKREKRKAVCVWIGEQVSEFEPAFGIWFHAQIEQSRDSSGALSVHFEPPGPLYPILMDAADIFLMTSRMDPLPNVALDAAARNVPVIAFSGATGLLDIAEQGKMDLIEVQVAAVDEVVAAIKSRLPGL